MCLSSSLFSNLFPLKRRLSDLLVEFLCGTFGFLLSQRMTGALFCTFPMRLWADASHSQPGGRNVPVQDLLRSWFKISFLLWSFPGRMRVGHRGLRRVTSRCLRSQIGLTSRLKRQAAAEVSVSCFKIRRGSSLLPVSWRSEKVSGWSNDLRAAIWRRRRQKCCSKIF